MQLRTHIDRAFDGALAALGSRASLTRSVRLTEVSRSGVSKVRSRSRDYPSTRLRTHGEDDRNERTTQSGKAHRDRLRRLQGVSSPMHPLLMLWLAVCAAGAALSCAASRFWAPRRRSRASAGSRRSRISRSPGGTRCGGHGAPAHADYVALAALTAAFVAAGLRDEPQAEPWWWPAGAGPTGRERRARR